MSCVTCWLPDCDYHCQGCGRRAHELWCQCGQTFAERVKTVHVDEVSLRPMPKRGTKYRKD